MDVADALDALEGYPVFCAYNANVDAIRRVDEGLETQLDPPGDPPEGRLDSTAELSAAIRETMRRGSGDERAMTDDLAARLESSLDADEERLGGQAGIMTDVLATLGASPVFYTYLLSERQRAGFAHPERIRVPVASDDGLAFRPIEEAPVADHTKLNWIFEFAAGERFHGTEARDASRFIAASRPDEFDLTTPVDDHARELGERVGCAVLSGYHSLNREYDDGGTFREKLANGRRVLRELAAETRVKVELGVTHDRDLRAAVQAEIAPEADVLSVDDHERNQLRDDLCLPKPDAETRIARSYQTLADIREELGVAAVSLHAKEYFLVVRDERYLTPEAVRSGLDFATVVAAAKAEDGFVTGRDDLEAAAAFERSPEGREAVASLADHLGVETDHARRGLVTPDAVAVPNRVVPHPASTVGIGDSVSVTSFAVACAVADETATA